MQMGHAKILRERGYEAEAEVVEDTPAPRLQTFPPFLEIPADCKHPPIGEVGGDEPRKPWDVQNGPPDLWCFGMRILT